MINRLVEALDNIGAKYRTSRNAEVREELLLEALCHPIARDLFDPFDLPMQGIDLKKVGLRFSISAVRMEGTSLEGNLKQSIFWGLLILHILRGTVNKKTKTLVDGGNVNSALALGQLTKRLGLKSHYVISHRFPNDIKLFVSRHVDRLHEAPAKSGVSIEREFYSELLGILRAEYADGTGVGLWHAKFGLDVARAIGKLLAREGTFAGRRPSKLVTMVGSGASLVLLESIRDNLGWTETDIVVAEHEACSNIWSEMIGNGSISFRKIEISSKLQQFAVEFRSSSVGRAPHAILGPHYEEINPYFLSCKEAHRFKNMMLVSDGDLSVAIGVTKALGLSVGNSSAVNILVSADLAARGEEVLTVTYEPRRSYYDSLPYNELVG